MIGETILHYPPKEDMPMAVKILEKLGEGGDASQNFFSKFIDLL